MARLKSLRIWRKFQLIRLQFILLTAGMSVFLTVGPMATPVSSVSVGVQVIPYQAGFPRKEPVATIDFVSPSVIDINGDGNLDVLTADSHGCVYAWDRMGNLLPGLPWSTTIPCNGSGAARIMGPLAIADINGDGKLEVAAGTRGLGDSPGQRGKVFVWDRDGSLLWTREMDWDGTLADSDVGEVGTVALANAVGDARLEVLAGTSNNAGLGQRSDVALNLYVWSANGDSLPGFPVGYRNAGIFGAIGAADLNGDSYAEVITGRDELYVHTYAANGSQLSGWPVRTYLDPAKTVWGRDPYIEFTYTAPTMGDLDGNGSIEVVITGKVRNPAAGAGHPVTNSAVLVLEPDGQRRRCWAVPPLGEAPVYSSFMPSMAPALADLNDDAQLEIVVTLFDGTIRAYDHNAILLWTYNYSQERRLFASEPVIGDVTGDGRVDIIFGTYSPDRSANSAVGLYSLDANGHLLPGFPLALTEEGSAAGVRAAPTLADLDGDGDVEILAASWGGTLYVWDLPAAYNASTMPWPTGRHDNLRSGAVTPSRGSAALSAAADSFPGAEHLWSASGNSLYLPLVVKNSCGG